jgi:hypothetical protein
LLRKSLKVTAGVVAKVTLFAADTQYIAGLTIKRRAMARRRNAKAPGSGAFATLSHKEILGRGERIRTSGLYVPNVALYQAKLHPDATA